MPEPTFMQELVEDLRKQRDRAVASRDAALAVLRRLANAADTMDNTNGTTRAPEAVREYLDAMKAARELLAK